MSAVISPAFPKPVHVHKTRKPMKRANRKRRAQRFADNFGERSDAIREMPCLLAVSGGCEGRTEAAHAKARGMGGVNSDRRSQVPLCTHHHQQSHGLGPVRFAALYRIDLHTEADRIARELDLRGLP